MDGQSLLEGAAGWSRRAAERSWAAGRVRGEIARLAGLFDPAVARVGPSSWVGPAADDGREELAAVRGELRVLVDGLAALARELQAEAEAAEGEAARLRSLADRLPR